jgi:hypothetical protein
MPTINLNALDLPSDSRMRAIATGLGERRRRVSSHRERLCIIDAASLVVTSPGSAYFVQLCLAVLECAKKSHGRTIRAMRQLRHGAHMPSTEFSLLTMLRSRHRSAAVPMDSAKCFVLNEQKAGLRDDLPFTPGDAGRAAARPRRRAARHCSGQTERQRADLADSEGDLRRRRAIAQH